MAMIDDLLDPSALPDPTGGVHLVQTHISYVIVADRFVYKIKKPVDFGFLDFSTLEKRRHYCDQEVRLNRRLAGEMYLGVLPVKRDRGRHRLGAGRGETVEYAVRMRRIPDEMLMKNLFRRGELDTGHLEAIARRLADFHASAETSAEIDRFAEPEGFRVNTDENFDQMEPYIGKTITREDFDLLKEWTSGFYKNHRDLFHQRIQAKRVRDCHGDLHMEHICFWNGVTVFDCIEFSDRLRYMDVLCDIGFLLMDLEFHGGRDHAEKLWEIYKRLSAEKDVESLLDFYKVYRAYVRGKVTSFRLDDDQIGPEEKAEAAQTAGRYFRLARAYVQGGAR